MNIIKLETINSTNSWLADNERNLQSPCLVYCVTQTAGRGQRGNSWESEPGKNITASLLFHPHNFPAIRLFTISEAIALSITDFINSFGVSAKIKWPNDIYIENKKVCGILVENCILGNNITRTIAGFGINMNQMQFVSDAPNPVSIAMLTGRFYNIDVYVRKLAEYLQKYLDFLDNPDRLHQGFLEALWRHDHKPYLFYDRKTDENIRATIKGVETDGILTLITQKGEERRYAFKEVEWLMS